MIAGTFRTVVILDCGGDSLRIRGCFFRSLRNRRGLLRGFLGGAGHILGGAAQFGRCRSHGIHNAADTGFETLGKREHGVAALGFRCDALIFLCGTQAAGFDQAVLEHFHGARHRADFVAAVRARNHHIMLARGDRAHCALERDDRSCEAAAHPGGDQDRDQDGGGGTSGEPLGGIGGEFFILFGVADDLDHRDRLT